MTNKISLLILLTLLVNIFPAKAQNVDFKLGKEMEGSDVYIQNQFNPVGTDSEGNSYLFFAANKGKTKVYKFSKDNILIAEKYVDISFLTRKGHYSQYEKFFILNDKAYVVVSTTDLQTTTVYAHELDLNTLFLSPVGKKLCSKKSVGKEYFMPIFIYFTPDSSKLLIEYRYGYRHDLLTAIPLKEPKYKPITYNYEGVVLDKNLDFISEFNEPFSYINNVFGMDATLFLNSGEVFSLGKLIQPTGIEDEYKVKATLMHLKSGTSTKKIEFELSGGNQPIITRIAPIQDENFITIFGFYSGPNRKEGYKGSFYLKIDQSTLKIVSEKINPFTDEIYNSFDNVISKDKEEKYIFKDLMIRSVFSMKDSSICFFSDEMSEFIWTDRTDYISNNILMFRYDNNGELTNQNVIERRLKNSRINSCSFSTFFNTETSKFYFTYMKNSVSSPRLLPFICSKVDLNLNVESEQIVFDSLEDVCVYLPYDNMKTSNNSMVGLFTVCGLSFKKRIGYFKFK